MARILLADDDQATRDLVKRALVADGHSVEVTQDGSEAIEQLTSGAARGAELLISDVQMPSLDGISLAEKAIAFDPSLRLILMSGFPEQLERARRLRAAKLGTITKPFSLEQIRALVKSILG